MPNCSFRCNQSIFANIQDSLFFFLLDKESGDMLIEPITNPSYSMFWLGMK